MALTFKVEAGTTVIDEGAYNAEISQIEAVDGKYGQSVRTVFTIFDADQGELELSGMCSARLTPGTKLGRWSSTLLGRTIQVDEAIDVEQFIGCMVEVRVENTTKSDGRVYSNVADIIRLISDDNSFLAAKRGKAESSETAAIAETEEDEGIPF